MNGSSRSPSRSNGAVALRRIGVTAARELALTALLLLGVSLVVFVILQLSPGDPFTVLLEGPAPRQAARASVGEALGVPTTWYGRYLAWLGHVAHGNLGTSIRTGAPVAGEIVKAGPKTLYLTLGSLLVTLLVAVPLALYSAARGGTLARALRIGAYLVSAVPVFWLGYVAIYLVIHRLGVFPLLSASAEPARHGWLYGLLPIVVLGVGNGTVSEVTRHLRGEIARVLTEDYIRTARAKGAPVWRHAFKEGFLLPMTETIAAKIPFIIGGAVIVEQVFNWPGLGRLAWQAAQDRDFPVILGIALVAATFVRLATLVRSVIYAGVNPRSATE